MIPQSPRLSTMNDEITKGTSEHKSRQWIEFVESIDHRTDSTKLWWAIKGMDSIWQRMRAPPSQEDPHFTQDDSQQFQPSVILRTFTTREIITMMTLFKSLVLDYASQLWSPHLLKSIYLIEKVQRSFTKHITGIKNKPYDERLKLLNLYSVQRRRDRYQIIYLWKIIEGLVPNLSAPITCTYSERRGRSCVVSHVNMGRLGTLSYNSFRWRSIRMFNKLPKYVRIVSSCSIDGFKSQLDKHLRSIVDLPCRVWIQQQSRWWILFRWRSLRRRPGCQLDATEQPQVTQVSSPLLSWASTLHWGRFVRCRRM